MTYVVLARKWRPQRFEDVVGQEHITGTLANAIAQNRVAHGYLFCGPRGVGKTTTARILAKALNCETGPTPTPCNKCSACREVDSGSSMDIIEADGASTRGIDDIRELRDNVRYAPTGGRTKIYIIDEVHMLTREAFNALLKTLEEPPPHVVFVMATTEAFKVPATILSRCQRFDFARIHPRAVAARLTQICEAEGIKADETAIAVLARRSAGGLRDALSALDQVLASSGSAAITEAEVDRVLGLLSSDFYFGLVDRLLSGDARGAIERVDEAYHAGADLGEVAEELARHLRNVMIAGLGGGSEKTLDDLGPPEVARLMEQAARISPATAARLLEVALRTIPSARRSDHLRLHLEMALIEMSEATKALSLGEVARKLSEMEQRLGGAAEEPAAPAPARMAPPAPNAVPPAPPAIESATGEIDPAALWSRVVSTVNDRKRAIGAFLIGSRGTGLDAEGRLVVEFDAEHALSRSHLEEDSNRRFVEDVLRELTGRAFRFRTRAAGEAEGNDTAAKPPRAKRSSHEIAGDTPIIKKALELFDGEIIP